MKFKIEGEGEAHEFTQLVYALKGHPASPALQPSPEESYSLPASATAPFTRAVNWEIPKKTAQVMDRVDRDPPKKAMRFEVEDFAAPFRASSVQAPEPPVEESEVVISPDLQNRFALAIRQRGTRSPGWMETETVTVPASTALTAPSEVPIPTDAPRIPQLKSAEVKGNPAESKPEPTPLKPRFALPPHWRILLLRGGATLLLLAAISAIAAQILRSAPAPTPETSPAQTPAAKTETPAKAAPAVKADAPKKVEKPNGKIPLETKKDIFEGNENSVVASGVGSAEGTRTPDGGKTRAYNGHVDPGNGVWNLGSFSYQHGATSPEDADRKQLETLKRQDKTIRDLASSLGMTLTLEERLNAIDLANQAPAAAIDARGGYVERLKQAKDKGLKGQEAILQARTYSFINPHTNQWDAPGLGNTEYSISRDQARRMGSISQTLELAAKRGLVSTHQTFVSIEEFYQWIKLNPVGVTPAIDGSASTT